MQINKNLLTTVVLGFILILLLVLLERRSHVSGHNGFKHIRNHHLNFAEIEVDDNRGHNTLDIFGEFETPYHHYGDHRPDGHRHHFYEELHEEF